MISCFLWVFGCFWGFLFLFGGVGGSYPGFLDVFGHSGSGDVLGVCGLVKAFL